MKNNRGQMVVEMLLIMIILVAVMQAVRIALRESEAFQTLVQAPWKPLSGMIQAGAWLPPKEAMVHHPNNFSMRSTVEGTFPK